MSASAETLSPVVLVSACSAGALVAHQFARHRPCVHAFTDANMSEGLRASVPAQLFDAQFEFDSEAIDDVVARLAPLKPVAVVAASEWGTDFVDQIATGLGLPSNDPATARARRDKFEMARYAGAAGVAVAAQTSGCELEPLLDWYRAHPHAIVVVKPRDSAGSDNVYVCRNESEVRVAVERVLGSANMMCAPNTTVLIQEYLRGDEFVINTVSRGGAHWVSDVWAVTKRLSSDGRNLYDHDDLVAPAECAGVADYTAAVLDAIGVAVGPAHTEVIVTAAGPRLLETGARVTGACNPEAMTLATGIDQIEMSIDCYLYPERFESRPRIYERVKHARSVHLISSGGPEFRTAEVNAFLQSLPSFHSVRFRAKDGSTLAPTVDVMSCPGAFFLVHESQAQIERDYKAFRAWELENL